jgi:hypothetical protein
MEQDMHHKLVYHHIPKCGGTSILRGITLTFYPLRFLRYGKNGFPGILNAKASTKVSEDFKIDVYEYRRLLLNYYLDKNDSPFIFGHYPFCENAYRKHKDSWSFVSLFREPVKRWYSEYYWNRYKNHSYGKTELDIEAYFASTQGRLNTRSYINYLTNAKNPASLAEEKDASNAIGNLDKLGVIGTLENLSAFQNALKNRFGRKPIFLKQNKNPASSENYQIPDEKSSFHKELLEYLAADIAVYEDVLKRTN